MLPAVDRYTFGDYFQSRSTLWDPSCT